jgi:hypothetical protein
MLDAGAAADRERQGVDHYVQVAGFVKQRRRGLDVRHGVALNIIYNIQCSEIFTLRNEKLHLAET